MEHLFVNVEGGLELAAIRIFGVLGLGDPLEGDTANTPSGIYFCTTVFGVLFRLEENVYDYEDRFEFMLAIKKDAVSDLEIPANAPTDLAGITLKMLSANLGVAVGIEIDDELHVMDAE